MTRPDSSYRQALRATSILGGATAASILIGLARTKLITLVVGPVGIGLFGVFNAVLMAAFMLAGLGVGTSGVTELSGAVAKGEAEAARVRAGLWSLTWALAGTGALALWLLREPVAKLAAGDTQHALAIGLLGIAVALNTISNTQLSVLQGFRRIGDLGRVKIWGALIAAVLGVGAVYLHPYWGLVAALVAVPVGNIAAALVQGRRLPPLRWREVSPRSVPSMWRALLGVGLGVMAWNLLSAATGLGVRALVVRENGLEAAGLFQASWMISSNYQILILAGMLNDYLVRLSAAGRDDGAVRSMINQQAHVALSLAAPLTLGLVALAPVALHLLYSSEFTGAAGLLQWQTAGDALKIASWTVALVLLARRDLVPFLFAEACLSAIWLLLVRAWLPDGGLEVIGQAYFAAYLVYATLVGGFAWWRYRLGLSRPNLVLAGVLVASLVALALLGAWSQLAAAVVGLVAALGFGLLAVRALTSRAGPLTGGLRTVAARLTRR